MRNVSDKSCRENQNTRFVFNIPPQKMVPFCDNMGRYGTVGQAPDGRMAQFFACWVTKGTDTRS